MKLFQHVFGRVSRGYQSTMPGYQVAAVSPELATREEALRILKDLSFYHFRARDGTSPARWSFFRPGSGLLAFGQVHMTRDLTGASGYLAHHYLCEEEDFLRETWTPVQLLQSLPFIASESQLPEDRTLASVPVPERHAGLQAMQEEQRQRALALLDRVFAKDRLHVPMLVIVDAEFFSLAEVLFQMLPRAESAQLSFSTLFCESGGLVDHFRLVTVPDAMHAQGLPEVYEVLLPSELHQATKTHELATFWRRHPQHGGALVTLANCLRHGVPVDGADNLSLLLGTGAEFRNAVDCLGIPSIYALLLSDAQALEKYWHSGAPVPYSALREAIWAQAQNRIGVLCEFIQRVKPGVLAAEFLVDLGRQLATGSASSDCFVQVQRSGLAPEFLRACTGQLEIRELQCLAERLVGTPSYAGEFHRHLAFWLLEHDTPQCGIEVEGWLRHNQHVVPLARAAVAVIDCLSAATPGLPSMADYSLEPSDLDRLLPWAWQRAILAAVRIDTIVAASFTPASQEAFFRALRERVGRLEVEPAASWIAAVVPHPLCSAPANQERLLAMVDRHPDARRLAMELLAALEHPQTHTSAFYQDLRDMVRRQSWMSRLGTWFYRRED